MITVVGDIMLDTYIYGSSIRMSPECSTAPVIKEFNTTHSVGGAGNTAINIHYLGQPVRLVAAFNKSSKLNKLLASEQVPFIPVTNHNQDVVKIRIYSNGQYLARVDYDYDVECSYSEVVKSVFDRSTDLIVLSDYNKGTIQNPQEIIAKANERGIAVLVDPKKDLESYRGAFVLKPNNKEFAEWADIQDYAVTPEIVLEAVKALGVQNLIITLGEGGSLLATADGTYEIFKAHSVKTVDTTGAGDSYLAGLAVALNEGKNIRKAIKFANKVAGIAVTKKGTAYVKRNEI
jgi:D-beta-D-heptose 7-phosphate kinase/D-beta-D-heptose 1-phosphate adenosyltransferase